MSKKFLDSKDELENLTEQIQELSAYISEKQKTLNMLRKQRMAICSHKYSTTYISPILEYADPIEHIECSVCGKIKETLSEEYW